MDAARTALRLGAEVHIVYPQKRGGAAGAGGGGAPREGRGRVFDLLRNPVEILTDENDWVTGMVIRKMELGEPGRVWEAQAGGGAGLGLYD